jgi:hypothetical protein
MAENCPHHLFQTTEATGNRASLDVHFVSPAPVHSPLGVGAQHAAPLRLLAVYL